MLLGFLTENGDNLAFGSSLYTVAEVDWFLLFKQRKPSESSSCLVGHFGLVCFTIFIAFVLSLALLHFSLSFAFLIPLLKQEK